MVIRLVKNWTVHNLICRPLSEIVYLLLVSFSRDAAICLSGAIHDLSIPEDHNEDGRGVKNL
jgi:hypothetical protein